MGIEPIVVAVGRVIEAAGVVVIAAGVAWSFAACVRALANRPRGDAPYLALRRDLGRSVLLGLEVLVAGDIVRTVASHPTLNTVAVLGGVVVIRTFLSVTIDTEVNGRWPWQGHRAGAPLTGITPSARVPSAGTGT